MKTVKDFVNGLIVRYGYEYVIVVAALIAVAALIDTGLATFGAVVYVAWKTGYLQKAFDYVKKRMQ